MSIASCHHQAVAAEPKAPPITDAAYTRPQQLVSVEGTRRLNLYCLGEGAPVVVFDSGLADSTKAWGLVQPEISKQTKACSYDRAGLGFSDPSTAAGTSKNAVSDLHRLLHAARLPIPFVLVGHSYGGMNVKLYAETYPREVAGLIFVDPSHEDLGRDTGALDPPTDITRARYLADLQRCLRAKQGELQTNAELKALCVPGGDPHYGEQINLVESEMGVRPTRIAAWISEMTHVWSTSAAEVRSAYRDLGSIPIVVLTKQPSAPVGAETPALREAKNSMWIRLHQHIAKMSSRGRRITVEGSGHYIQHDRPEIVIDAIGSVLRDIETTRDF